MAMPALPWDFEPGVVAGCLFLAAAYAAATRLAERRRALVFIAADLVIFLALASPLDALADHYLFSAHMLQHLLLLEVAPPLLILGIPPGLAQRYLDFPAIASVERGLRRPLLAWAIGFAALCFWHWPPLYDAAVARDPVHALEHLSFVVSACIFWWPVLSPMAASRLDFTTSVFYLFSRMSANLVLGTLIASVPLGVYTAYRGAPQLPGVLAAISPLLDQRLGGFLMWLPTLLVDFTMLPLLAALWNARTAPILGLKSEV